MEARVKMVHLLLVQDPIRIHPSSTDKSQDEHKSIFFHIIHRLTSPESYKYIFLRNKKYWISNAKRWWWLLGLQKYHSFHMLKYISYLKPYKLFSPSCHRHKIHLTRKFESFTIEPILFTNLILRTFAVAITLISQHLLDILKDGKTRNSSLANADHLQRSRPH